MKFFFYTFFIIFVSCANCDEPGLIATALSQIINKVSEKQTDGFELILCGKKSKRKHFHRVITKLEKLIEVPQIRRRISSYSLTQTNQIERSAILFFNNWDSYKTFFFRSSLTNKYDKYLYFLIYIDEQREFYNWNTVKVFVNNQPRFYHEHFLNYNKTSITLSAAETFVQPHCRDIRQVEINHFLKSDLKWENQKFTMEKFENFNGCEMNIAAVFPQNLALSVDFDANGENFIVRGYTTTFNELISKSLNYTYIYNPVSTNFVFNKTWKNDFHIEVDSFRKITMDGVAMT